MRPPPASVPCAGGEAVDDGMAARQYGPLGLLCQYSNANPEAIAVVLEQGWTVVFTGEGYEVAVRLTPAPPRVLRRHRIGVGSPWPPLPPPWALHVRR